MSNLIDQILGQGGALSKHLDGYTPRPQQLQMARAVESAFEGESKLLVEAATGTGKTLAYLIPAILSGQRVVVSTATKALQAQIVDKDIPLLRRALARSHPFSAVTVKGRTNYLCLYRYESNVDTVTFARRSEHKYWPKVKSWARRTHNGDRASIPGLPDNFSAWSQISANGMQCLGGACPKHEECFVNKVRKDAQNASIIIVNHHLFFADLNVRYRGFGEILPNYDAVIFDEAHHLEDIVTQYFGDQVSAAEIDVYLKDLKQIARTENTLSVVGTKLMREVETSSKGFFDFFRTYSDPGRQTLEDVLINPTRRTELEARTDALRESIRDLSDWIDGANFGSVGKKLTEQCFEIGTRVESVTDYKDATRCRVVERRDRAMYLESVPIDAGGVFRSRVLTRPGAQIYASATLTAGGSFDYFQRRLGMERDKSLATLKLPPVFDYASNALFYVPRRLPDPKSPQFLDGVCKIVKYLLELTQGRAFVLFTSYKNMTHVYDALHESLPFNVLKQGDAPKGELLNAFREDMHSVLFATSSFWEGVDVSGASLSLVIMDKLPFASPGEPLVRARQYALEDKGIEPFRGYLVPDAAITLKQGFGRLIRSHTDRGIVALLDSRVASKSYGKVFLDSLPPCRVVWNAWEVRDWWKEQEEKHGPLPSGPLKPEKSHASTVASEARAEPSTKPGRRTRRSRKSTKNNDLQSTLFPSTFKND